MRTARSSCGKRCCRASPFSIISTPRVRLSGLSWAETREADRKQTIRRTHERSALPIGYDNGKFIKQSVTRAFGIHIHLEIIT